MSKIVSVVIPVHNNQTTLQRLCEEIVALRALEFNHLALEIVFVNDGSTDNSWDELLCLQEVYPDIIVLIDLSRNFGQLGALFAGFNHAKGDAIICLSADLQDPTDLIGRMISYWEANTEIVICYRQARKDGWFNRLTSRVAYAIARISSPDLPDGGFDYWLMSRRVCKLLCSLKGRHNFIQGYLLSLGYSRAFIPYTRQPRAHGRSGYDLGKKIKIFVDFLVDTSYLPIRFMSGLGALFSLTGIVYSVLIVYAWWSKQTPFSGWAPLMIMIMIIGGIIMVMLGVIGEYIWRIYDNGRDFPLFVVQSKLEGSTKIGRAIEGQEIQQ